MMTPAVDRGLRKAIRTFVQVAASGGLTVAVDTLGDGLSPTGRTYVAALWLVVVTFCQNTLETRGWIPTLLPAAGLITKVPGAVMTKTVGTVSNGAGAAGGAGGAVAGETGAVMEATMDETGKIVGDVVDLAGKVVGDVTGQVDDPAGGVTNSGIDDDPDSRGGI